MSVKTVRHMTRKGDSQVNASRKYIFVGLSFAAQGVWAYYANNEFGSMLALRTGIIHGLLCALLTLCSALTMESVFYRIQHDILKLIMPAISACLVMLLLSTVLHQINGTPSLITTLLPLILLGVPYYVIYTYLLWRSNKDKNQTRKI